MFRGRCIYQNDKFAVKACVEDGGNSLTQYRDNGKHSGGQSIFTDKGHYDTWNDYLYVAAMGVECNVTNPTDEDYIKMGWVVYLEYEAFTLYYRSVGGHPNYNQR